MDISSSQGWSDRLLGSHFDVDMGLSKLGDVEMRVSAEGLNLKGVTVHPWSLEYGRYHHGTFETDQKLCDAFYVHLTKVRSPG